jgi:hypothetical protein
VKRFTLKCKNAHTGAPQAFKANGASVVNSKSVPAVQLITSFSKPRVLTGEFAVRHPARQIQPSRTLNLLKRIKRFTGLDS